MANAGDPGIVGQQAPAWEVEEWINLPSGPKVLDAGYFKGKVLYLYCFQAWRPGCHSSGFPSLKAVSEQYKGRDDVAFVAIQTAFEGGESNSFQRAKEIAKKYKLTMPIGQAGDGHGTPSFMRKYKTGGTPWTLIIDKKGIVRFNAFHISAEKASKLIDDLLAEVLQ